MTQWSRLGPALAWSALLLLAPAFGVRADAQIIINHETRNRLAIPDAWINQAKATLHIAYGHTSHGSQITDGMSGLAAWKGSLYAWNRGGTGGALDLDDGGSGILDGDVGYYPDWVNYTRAFLGTPNPSTGRGTSHPNVNVIMWSWCGQASGYSAQEMVDQYLTPMSQLEADYPGVKFVYMTGHLDGSGATGNLNLRNQQIRNYVIAHNKILYDFADIESYDPDGHVHYMPLNADDGCNYDGGNWCTAWQSTHTLNVDWYQCSSAHTEPLNGNLKAYAAWWLWARLAGWNGNAVVPNITVNDATAVEAAGNAVFTVSLSVPTTVPVTVSYATSNGTAAAGGDYTAVSGSLTFAVGSTSRTISVPILPDAVYEPNESFSLNLSNAVGGTITDASGLGTIQNDDPMPQIAVEDCAAIEGHSGTASCAVKVTLSGASNGTVTVAYATAPGTATAGSDYTTTSGTASFPPLTTGPQTIAVPLLGDTAIEGDETFVVNLSSASGASLPDAQATGTIVDDDALSLSSAELSHGSCVLAQLGQPSPGVDFFRLSQRPRASYEVLVDAVAGDAVPLTVERVAGDNVTVLGTATPLGAGSSLSMRWKNALPAAVDNQHLRVSAGCAGGCTADDSYRICLRETTGSSARFNNGGSQVTVLQVQNPASLPASGSVFFWSTGGVLFHEQPFTLAAHASLTLNTAGIPALQARNGSITMAHDAPYGGLTGKAVAIESGTGFSFDSVIEARR